jgi:hypothetical protein
VEDQPRRDDKPQREDRPKRARGEHGGRGERRTRGGGDRDHDNDDAVASFTEENMPAFLARPVRAAAG